MQRAGKKAALLVLIFFVLLAPAMASSKGTKPGDGGGIFLSLYQEQYQNAFYILIPSRENQSICRCTTIPTPTVREIISCAITMTAPCPSKMQRNGES